MLHKTTWSRSKTDDIFWRKEYATKIWRLVENKWKNGFVLSINSWWWEWKTTFLEDIFIPNMKWSWYKDNIVLFDAFEHDFFDNPLTAITWSFLKWIWIEWKEKLEDKAKKILKISWRVLLRYLMRWDLQGIENRTEWDIEKDITDFAINELSSYMDAEKSISEFKEQLWEYTKNLEKPLIFIIDELDRCKPSFALKIIEIIKHFFSTENVVFILSINKEQITNYISHQYWDSTDSENYLHKFLDIETELPNESWEWSNIKSLYCQHLYKKTGFERKMTWIISILPEMDISLREIEKVFNYLKLMEYSLWDFQIFDLHLSCILCYLKVKKYNLYLRINKWDFNEKSREKVLHEIFKSWDNPHLKNIIEFTFNINCSNEIVEEFKKIYNLDWEKRDMQKNFLNSHLLLLRNFS